MKGYIVMAKWIITVIAMLNSPIHAEWTQQGGPQRTGDMPYQELNTEWDSTNAPIKWRANAGFGSSPVVVSNGRVYTFGAFKPGTTKDAIGSIESTPTFKDISNYNVTYAQAIELFENAEIEAFIPGHMIDRGEADAELLKLRFYRAWEYAQCFDINDGHCIWATRLSDRLLLSNNHVQWGLSSPLIHGNGLYIHTSNGRLFRLNAKTGVIEWENDLFLHGMKSFHDKQGNAAGPLLFKNKVIIQFGPRQMIAAAFDTSDGRELWRYATTATCFRTHFARLGFSYMHNEPTVLLPAGHESTGINPEDGTPRWEFDMFKASTQYYSTMLDEIRHRTDDEEKIAKLESRLVRGYAPYASYHPVAWNDYVVDYRDYAHEDFISTLFCYKIHTDGTPEILWHTNRSLPESYPDKSNMIARDGKLYLFDFCHYFYHKNLLEVRPGRGAGEGQFQCVDIKNGDRLWTSDAFRTSPTTGPSDSSNGYKFIMSGKNIIVTASQGFWIGTVDENGANSHVFIPAKKAGYSQNLPSEPVLSDHQLFIRQLAPHPGSGYFPTHNDSGNLFCLDLSCNSSALTSPTSTVITPGKKPSLHVTWYDLRGRRIVSLSRNKAGIMKRRHFSGLILQAEDKGKLQMLFP